MHAVGPNSPIRYPAAALFELARVRSKITRNIMVTPRFTTITCAKLNRFQVSFKSRMKKRIGHCFRRVAQHGGDNVARN